VVLTSSAGPLYSWSNGQSSQSVTISQSGRYSVTIKDAQGLKSLPSDSVTVTAFSLPVLSAPIISNVDCHGSSTGSVLISAAGGLAPYQYLWSDGQTVSEATGLKKGNYSLTVKDANLCSVTKSVNIAEPDSLAVVANSIGPRCSDAGDGSISLTITGGTSPYSVSWSGGLTGTTISNLQASVYNATVTDANNCILQKNYSLENQMESCLNIPTIITPNGDSHNDSWEISGIDVYPRATVEVFDRQGKRVYYSEGYPSPWDGRFEGMDLPMDSYHYVIDLHNGRKPLIGLITIVR
jgi:gliding motility-associated-like protein